MAAASSVTTDAGQTLLIAAADSDADYSFRITIQDGSDYFFAAKVMDYTTDYGSLNNILMANASLEVTSDIVRTA